jgi:sulfofructose kinase
LRQCGDGNGSRELDREKSARPVERIRGGSGVKREGRVICVGLAVMDQIYTVERLPETPTKHFATDFREIGGGPAANAAVAVARLGGEARLWSRVADDSIGDRIVRELDEEGVAVAGIRRIPGARSGSSAIVVDARGERMIVNFRGREMDPDPAWLPMSEITGAGAVLGDLRWPEGSARALSEARRLGVPALLDADATPGREGAEAFATADHILFSSQGLIQLTGVDEIERALRLAASRTDAWVGVSAGRAGVYWLEGERLRHLPGFDVEVVDTLGAGDVLHGAFALALARGDGIEEALGFACAAAALKCARPGGRAGAPNTDEVEAFLEERARQCS